MDLQSLHQLIDEWAAKQPAQGEPPTPPVEEPKRELPKDKRVVRTKTSGDRVYLIDEVAKTRQWITRPEILDELGFTMADVVEVNDEEFLKYNQGTALYKAP